MGCYLCIIGASLAIFLRGSEFVGLIGVSMYYAGSSRAQCEAQIDLYMAGAVILGAYVLSSSIPSAAEIQKQLEKAAAKEAREAKRRAEKEAGKGDKEDKNKSTKSKTHKAD